jgi:hypothetical protein
MFAAGESENMKMRMKGIQAGHGPLKKTQIQNLEVKSVGERIHVPVWK